MHIPRVERGLRGHIWSPGVLVGGVSTVLGGLPTLLEWYIPAIGSGGAIIAHGDPSVIHE